MGSLITETPFSEITATLEVLDRLGVGREDLKKFRAAPREVQGQVGLIFKNADSMKSISTIVERATPEHVGLSVDYDKTLEQMIAAGQYDWVDNDITPKRFKLEGKGVVKFETRIVQFGRDVSSEEAVEAIRRINTKNLLEPAKIEHLLTYGAKYPEEQCRYPIVALGSVAKAGADLSVPCLSRGGATRVLNLHWRNRSWDSDCRFLAVRTLSSAA